MSKPIQYYFDKTAYTYKHATAISIEVEDLKVWQAEFEVANEKIKENIFYEQEIEAFKGSVEILKEENSFLQTELEAARVALQWIADQPCQMDAEGSDKNCDCTETGACTTEYCLPCYAKTALRSSRAKAEKGEGENE